MKPASEVLLELLQKHGTEGFIKRYESLWYGDEFIGISPHDLSRIINKVEAGEISHANGRKVFRHLATLNREFVNAVSDCHKELQRIENDSRI